MGHSVLGCTPAVRQISWAHLQPLTQEIFALATINSRLNKFVIILSGSLCENV
jgi:hypothetical protein